VEGGVGDFAGWAESVSFPARSLAVAVSVGPDDSNPSMGTTLVLVGRVPPGVFPGGPMSDATEPEAVWVGAEPSAFSSAKLSETPGRVS